MAEQIFEMIIANRKTNMLFKIVVTGLFGPFCQTCSFDAPDIYAVFGEKATN